MALTKVSRGLLSTSIEDNGNATAITIDSSENVGIGTSSPAYTLTVKKDVDDYIAKLENDGNSTSSNGLWVDTRWNTATNTVFKVTTNSGSIDVITAKGDGNVGIGTSSPVSAVSIQKGSGANAYIEVAGNNNTLGSASMLFGQDSGSYGYCWNRANQSILFGTNSTERARIDSSGNLLVGTTSTSVTGTNGIQMFPADVGANKPRINIATAGYTSADYPLSLWSTAVSAWRFYVQADGRISAVYTAINSLSDERVKENIRDLDDGLSKVMQLQPRKFDWKEGKGKNITNDRGFIAQEFEQVFPDLVSEWKDEAPEGEEPYKSVSADLIPTLVKAIQEQQTLIESLTARIAALEE